MKDTILICGGGIGGISVALGLGQKGYHVQLLEQSTVFGEVGAGIQLGPNVFKMFKNLDLTDSIKDLAVFPKALVMRDGRTKRELTRVSINNQAFQEKFFYPYAVISRPDLHNIILEACRKYPTIELILGQNVIEFNQTENSVSVICDSGDKFSGGGLIAADGLWSRTRESIVADGKPRVSGHIAYRAILPLSEVPEHLRWKEVVLWAGPKTHLVQYPLHRGEVMNLVAVFHSDRYEEGWNVFGSPEELHERFRGQHPDVLSLLDKIKSWRMWVLCDREPVQNWTHNRVGLLGDAAHPMLQYLAQGACMAIEDAVCFTNQLEKRNGNISLALKDYQAKRYLRTARVQLTARFYGDVYHAAGPTAELRNLALKERTQTRSYESMEWLYNGVNDVGEQIL